MRTRFGRLLIKDSSTGNNWPLISPGFRVHLSVDALSNTANMGGNYAISDRNNVRLWAAVQLYLLTNDAGYGDWLSTYVSGLSSLANKGTNYWGLQPLALAEYYPAAGALQNKIVSLLAAAVESWRTSLVAPFGVEPLDGITFGANEANMSKAADAFRLFSISGDPAARDAAVRAIQWTFGVNPWDVSWVSGIGSNYTKHLHTRLMGDYYDNKDFTALRVTRVDAAIDFDWGAGSPDPSLGPDTFSCRWTGQIQPLYSETYTFYTYAGDGVRLWIDNKIVIQNWTDHAATENSGLIALEAGQNTISAWSTRARAMPP